MKYTRNNDLGIISRNDLHNIADILGFKISELIQKLGVSQRDYTLIAQGVIMWKIEQLNDFENLILSNRQTLKDTTVLIGCVLNSDYEGFKVFHKNRPSWLPIMDKWVSVNNTNKIKLYKALDCNFFNRLSKCSKGVNTLCEIIETVNRLPSIIKKIEDCREFLEWKDTNV